MGWESPSYGTAEVFVLDGRMPDASLLEHLVKADIHIFSGLGSHKILKRVMRRVAKSSGGSISVMTESWDTRGARGPLRWLKYRLLALELGRHCGQVFAIGDEAIRQFSSLPFLNANVVPFAYSVYSPPPLEGSSEDSDSTEVRIVYVASLIERKNPQLLLRDWPAYRAAGG